MGTESTVAQALRTRAFARGVVIAATLDTKSTEIGVLVEELRRVGLVAILVDCGVLGDATLQPHVSAGEVAALGGAELSALRADANREHALPAMTRGLAACLSILVSRGMVQGFVGMGGGTNAAFAAAAFREMPFGIPKLSVSTTASGDTSSLVGIKDVVLMHSVVDVLGVGSYLRELIRRAAYVMRALVSDHEAARPGERRRCIGVTAFGSTTQAANRAFDSLTAAGYDVLTFHARGTGGRAMEQFIRDGRIDGVLDLTTTEIADEVSGGLLSAGPTRLEAGIDMAVPQVILPGAVDMVNFGRPETVPAAFAHRTLLRHTPTTTLMRTSAEEMRQVAAFISSKLHAPRAPVTVIVPTRGFSAYDREGQPFFDPAADDAFLRTLRATLSSAVRLVEVDAHINDPIVAELAVQTLAESMATNPQQRS